MKRPEATNLITTTSESEILFLQIMKNYLKSFVPVKKNIYYKKYTLQTRPPQMP